MLVFVSRYICNFSGLYQKWKLIQDCLLFLIILKNKNKASYLFTHLLISIFFTVICSPLLRDVVALGLGSANLTLSMSTSLVIIGGAWCIYRPGLALLILVVAALPFIRAAVKHQSTVGHSRRPNGYRRSSAD